MPTSSLRRSGTICSRGREWCRRNERADWTSRTIQALQSSRARPKDRQNLLVDSGQGAILNWPRLEVRSRALRFDLRWRVRAMSYKRSALLAAACLGVAGIASAAPSIGVKYVDNGNAGVQNGNVDSLGA